MIKFTKLAIVVSLYEVVSNEEFRQEPSQKEQFWLQTLFMIFMFIYSVEWLLSCGEHIRFFRDFIIMLNFIMLPFIVRHFFNGYMVSADYPDNVVYESAFLHSMRVFFLSVGFIYIVFVMFICFMMIFFALALSTEDDKKRSE